MESDKKNKWQLRSPYFRGANTYKFTFADNDGTQESLDLIVDELGYFELKSAPNGLYSFAKLAQ